MPIWSKNNLRPRLLLHGHHGVGNVGDDAMLRCAVDQLKASAPDLKITLSAGPLTDLAWCAGHGIRLISRSRTSLLKALRNHDALAVVGGTWIHSPVGKIRYDLVTISLALLLTAARAFGLRTALVGLGIGPIDKQFGNRIAGLACGRADFISVRDPASWNWLNGARLKGVQTVRCADPAYAMSPGDLPRNPLRLGISALPYHAGYSKKRLGDTGIVDALSEVASDWLARSPGHEVVLLPFNCKSGVDKDGCVLEPVLRRQAGSGRIRLAGYSPDPSWMLGQVASCGAMIAMRYHSIVFAHLAGTPAVVIDYHGKSGVLLDEIGFPSVARIAARDVAPGTLRPLAAQLGVNPATHLAAKSPDIFRGLLENVWPPGLLRGVAR